MLLRSSDTCRGPGARHVVAVVAPAVVLADEPGVGLGLELADRGEAPPLEGGVPALAERGAQEALGHGIVWLEERTGIRS